MGAARFLERITRSHRMAFWLLFLVAFAVRAWTLTLYPPGLLGPNTGWESGAIAQSLLRTGHFADPYLIPTGPTAHVPPVYVYLLAGIYGVFGFTPLGGLVRWLVILGSYSLMCALLPWVGEKVGVGREAGFLGGLMGAFLALWPGEVEGFAGVALALFMVAFVRRWSAPTTSGRASVLMGLAIGATLHVQPALLPVFAACVGFELWWRRTPAGARGAALVVLGAAVACLPWAIRNQRVFGEQFFVRSNLGLELYVGNHPGAHADIDVSSRRRSFTHPRTDLGEAELVRELGEMEYMRRKGREALDWVRDEPGAFTRLTATRVAYVWLGPLHDPALAALFSALTLLAAVGAWRILPTLSIPGRAVLLIPLLTYPLIYYVVAYQARYRDPVNWILLLLAGAAFLGARAGGQAVTRPRSPQSRKVQSASS